MTEMHSQIRDRGTSARIHYRLPENTRALFATFARPGAHDDRYKEYLMGRDNSAYRPHDPVCDLVLPGVIIDDIRHS